MPTAHTLSLARFPGVMKTELLLPAITLFGLGISGFGDEPMMTKVVVSASGPKIPRDSFATKPKTLYLAGVKYGRVEEEADLEHGMHVRFVVDEPDTWIVNLVTKSAQHIVDKGPTFEFHAPIIGSPETKGHPATGQEFKGLNFGNEVQYFREQKARDLGEKNVGEKKCKAFGLKTGAYEVTLFLDPATGQPYQLDVVKNNKPEISFRYLEYQTNLPFQKSLFEPPDGVNITEAK